MFVSYFRPCLDANMKTSVLLLYTDVCVNQCRSKVGDARPSFRCYSVLEGDVEL